jgi:hypothetical protein
MLRIVAQEANLDGFFGMNMDTRFVTWNVEILCRSDSFVIYTKLS